MERLVRISDAASLAMHALGALVCLPAGERQAVDRLAGALGVSAAHLSKVLQRLGRAGLVDSTRGPGGGWALREGAAAATLLDVHEVVAGPLPASTCLLGHERCPDGACVMGELLHKVHADVHAHLRDTRVADLATAPSFARFRGEGPPTEARR